MNRDGPVLVIGASGVDIKARVSQPLESGIANPGVVQQTLGGAARNIAENLAHLEVSPILLSAVGEDHAGDFVLNKTAKAGVDTTYVLRVPSVHTGSYVAIVDHEGQVAVGVSEYDIVDAIAPRYLQSNRQLFADASMVVIDANLSPKTINSVFTWAKRYDVPVCADPTSQPLAHKLIPHLADLYMVTPNAVEAATLCQFPEPPTTSEAAVETAQCLVSLGAKIALVTLAEQGLAYAGDSSAGHIPALRTQVVDTTGVGDALTAAVIFGLLQEMPLDEAIRLGISAAALTLRVRDTVVPNLSLDLIYDELVV